MTSECCCCFWLDRDGQIVIDKPTGKVAVNKPGCYCHGCNPFEKKTGYKLGQNEYMIVKDMQGALEIIYGPNYHFLGAYDVVEQDISQAVCLDKTEYIYVRNNLSGEIMMEKGPQLYRPPDPYHVIEKSLKSTPLKLNEYMKILNRESGKIRVERGVQTVYLTPFEEAILPKKGKKRYSKSKAQSSLCG